MGTATMEMSLEVGLCASSGAKGPFSSSTAGATSGVGPTVVVSVPSEERSTLATDLLRRGTVNNGFRDDDDDDEEDEDDEFDRFDDLELGNDQVPLGEILDKLDAAAGEVKGNLIRLHAGDSSSGSQTISATLNVATLDLSDPESIHRHLSQLNDTVLKVSTASLSLRRRPRPSPPVSPPCSPSQDSSSPLSPVPPPPVMQPLALNLPSSPLPPTATSAPTTPTHSILSSSSPGSGKSSPQVCSICSKTFSNASALAKHRLTHSEERRYQCTICGKAFKRQDHLNGHLLTHRSTKPFACMAEGCGKSYCDARSLRRHKENHHHHHSSKGASFVRGTDENSDSRDSSISVTDNQENGRPPRQGLVVNAKGLSPQQVQLIEQLFKESNNLTGMDGATACSVTSEPDSSAAVRPVTYKSTPLSLGVQKLPSSPKKTDAAATASSIAAKALATVQNQAFHLTSLAVSPNVEGTGPSNPVMLAEKPVECTMCSRKFKNIPALNGHMRLHGGYYKKDAEGKRIGNARAETAASNGSPHLRPLAAEEGRKRKMPVSRMSGGTPNKLSPEAVQLLQQSPPPQPESSFCPDTTRIQPSSLLQPSPDFSSLPPPDTSQLLANLERKNQAALSALPQQQQQQSATKVAHSSGKVLLQLPTMPIPSLSSSVTVVAHAAMDASAYCQLHPKMMNVMKVDAGSDKTPKIGAAHQADIPESLDVRPTAAYDRSELLWDPRTAAKLTPQALQSYLTLASSCLVPGGSRNEEMAMEHLQRHAGNTQQALLALMGRKESRAWSEVEVDHFYEGLVKHHKDFRSISADVATRNVKECVEYYYLWKNFCREESQSFKTIFATSLSEHQDCMHETHDDAAGQSPRVTQL